MSDVTVQWLENLQLEVTTGHHRLIVDEPVSAGGQDAGPDPYELILSALGSCTALTVLLYARRKEWKVDRLQVHLDHDKIHAEECLSCETKTGQIDRISMQLDIQGDLTDEQLERLREIAKKCPVRRTLTNEIIVEETVVRQSGIPT